ncbi:MAG: bifunctional 5,10-methylenetetrahydrofolate dehydrogenase/5,10-methenyltetrahydrofolate cyclohydrolase [Nannocystaceae bacterium]|nr:bifunctional 5,10-methylenetetrahydrofolate dehydrogenase/5,10-methenyltetrahydrofolate cyclohydrolase [Nannocystaceae bacterium]
MSATILDGKAVAAQLLRDVGTRVQAAKARGVEATLAVILVGDDPASAVYVRNKERRAAEVGIATRDHRLPASTTAASLHALVRELDDDRGVDGILVQLPLPAGIPSEPVLLAVDPAKDVDGFHPDNLGRLMIGKPRFVACTPAGCMRLLAHAGATLAGARALVIGRSTIVGRPMAQLLLQADATVVQAHSRTRDLRAEVERADIVVAAVGRAELVRGEWIKPGAIVIDVGTNRTAEGRLVGDVDFAGALSRAAAITPVPGGVGPMTIACLLDNVALAAERRAGLVA